MQKVGVLLFLACLLAVSFAKTKSDRYGKTSRIRTRLSFGANRISTAFGVAGGWQHTCGIVREKPTVCVDEICTKGKHMNNVYCWGTEDNSDLFFALLVDLEHATVTIHFLNR